MIFGVSVYFILMDFYIFAFAGWVYESTFVSVRDRKLVNRGFLVGPILPLYGFGAVLVYLLLRPFSEIASLLYVMGMLVATVIEYVTSWLLEVLFHAKWWDYSKEPYNYKGRIALIPSMFWGILSLLIFDVFQPVADWLIGRLPEEYGYILLTVLMVITLIDMVYTIITTVNFRKQLENLYEFRKELEYLLQDMNFTSLKELLSSTTKGMTEKISSMSLTERKELLQQKFAAMREALEENDSGFTALEERFYSYWETYSRFLKKAPLFGNQRLLDAFPTMKIITKNHAVVEVKGFFQNLGQKAGWYRKKKEEESVEEEQEKE